MAVVDVCVDAEEALGEVRVRVRVGWLGSRVKWFGLGLGLASGVGVGARGRGEGEGYGEGEG